MFKDVIENLEDGVFFVDQDKTIIYWNQGAEKITGYSKKEMVGKCCSDGLLDHYDLEGFPLCDDLCPFDRSLKRGTSTELEARLKKRDGSQLPVYIRVIPMRDESGKIVGSAQFFTDITLKLILLDKVKTLENRTSVDLLTDLPNRSLVEFSLKSRLNEFERNHWNFGVIMMDIDHFKSFNDKYGHDVGDEVLKIIAKVIVKNQRAYDVVGRWGGEEFVGIISSVDKFSLLGVAERFRLMIENQTIKVGRKKIRITVSIGGTIVKAGDTAESMIKRADINLYQSKKKGRNCVTIE